MPPIAWRTVRGRVPGLAGALVGILLGVVLTTVWGVCFESSLRMKAVPERFAAADVVVDGDPWVKDTEPGGRRLQALLPEERPLPEDLTDRIRAVPGVREAVADRPFSARFADADGKVVGASGDRDSRGYSWRTAALGPFRVVSGKPPARLGEVMPDRRTAEEAGVEPGDEIRVLTASGARNYRVSGIAERGRAGQESSGGGWRAEAALFFSDRAAEGLARAAGGVPGPYAIAVVADHGVTARELAARIEDRLHRPGVRVLYGSDKGEAEGREIVQGRDFALAVSASFGLLAALFATVIVIGPFTIAVQQRRREIALLRAVGATRGRVSALLCGEALALTCVGVVVGGPLGLLLAGPVRDLFVSMGVLPAGLTLVRGPLPILAAALLSLVGTQAAALLAIRGAVRIRPVEALREAERPPGRMSVVRVLAGVLTIAAGIVLTLRSTGTEVGVMKTLAQVGVLLLGVVLIGPLVVRGGMILFGPLMVRLGGVSGRVARGALRTDSRRLASAVVPLTVVSAFTGTVLFTGATLETRCAEQAEARMNRVDRVLVADGTEGLPPDVVAAARKLPAVREVAPAVETGVVVRHSSPVGDILESFPAQGVEPETTADLLDLEVSSGQLAALRAETVAVSASLARKAGWSVGDRVAVVLGDGTTARLRVVAVFQRSEGFGELLLPYDLALRHVSLGLITKLYLALRPGAPNADAQLDRLRKHVPAGLVLNRTRAAEQVEAVSTADTRSRYLLLGSLVAFGAAAAATALTMASVHRKRDLRLMRTLGADRRQLMRVVMWEWLAVSVLALLAGAIVAVLPLMVFSRGATGSVLPSLPIMLVVGTVVSTVLLALVANLLPATMALRLRTLDGTRSP
ncbi:ABC transporter permease [Streptomyces sp. NEAU-Y11]|uniref:ABC transporter permease n=1 Tax=Streptomyces cucumeris TaxID=2962890 RepID=UPI0020C936B6|nr:FtsX-like permease family protein [Streptomyces sp. NEAU-Y11]MCP9211616.1 FtsX-like permease family protein [Streptomyces sp. NEAU-Y11]